jgi:hypothetical protein
MHLTSGHRGRNSFSQNPVSGFDYDQQRNGFAAVFARVRTMAGDLGRAHVERGPDATREALLTPECCQAVPRYSPCPPATAMA